MRNKSNLDKPGIAGAEDESDTSATAGASVGTGISDLLDRELERNERSAEADTAQRAEKSDAHWVLEIHEKEKVRMERVKIPEPAQVSAKL
jgi:hypothetical protein